jgi:hypothetical protein
VIQKEPPSRKDKKSSAKDSLRYGEGVGVDRETGEIIDKSLRTRLGGFGLVENGVYQNIPRDEMLQIIDLAAAEMQANCDLNKRVEADKKIMHRIFSWDQYKPTEAVLRDTEDSALATLKLDKNHFATFLHNDNGHWHLHLFASRIDKVKHSGNSLWMSHQKLDKICREVELRHGLKHDAGMHDVDEHGNIIAIPFAELRERRLEKQANGSKSISDKAQAIETYSGEKSFQTWANEIRIGDRLKHAKSWQELHATAAAYGLEIKAKGAGFTISPIGQKGGMQLSKLGVKNLPAKFGAFETAALATANKMVPSTQYQPEPTKPADALYATFKAEKLNHKTLKLAAINTFNDQVKTDRQALKQTQREELALIRSDTKGADRFAAVSVAKMAHVVAVANLIDAQREERASIYQKLSALSPGATFREFVVQQAEAGSDDALVLARKYAAEKATTTLSEREEVTLQIIGKVSGNEYRAVPRLPLKHRVTWLGSVVYDLGHGHKITDKISPNQIQLNDLAARDPASIETSLRFAAAKFGGTLTLAGSRDFQLLAVQTSVSKGLGIKFADPALEKYRQTLLEQHKEQQNAARTIRNDNRNIPPAHRRDRLRQLSELNVAGVENIKDVDTKQSTVLLSENVRDYVGWQGHNADHLLRRNGSRRRYLESSANPSHSIETSPELYADRVVDTKSSSLPNPSRAQSAVELQANNDTDEQFDKAAIDAEVREHCDNAKILAIKNSSVVVNLGRKKAIIHDVENAETLEPGEMISIKNKVASLIKNEKSKGITR